VSHALGRRLALGVEARYTRAGVDLARAGGDAVPVHAGGLRLIAVLSVGF
jgi:hypothetical protein